MQPGEESGGKGEGRGGEESGGEEREGEGRRGEGRGEKGRRGKWMRGVKERDKQRERSNDQLSAHASACTDTDIAITAVTGQCR